MILIKGTCIRAGAVITKYGYGSGSGSLLFYKDFKKFYIKKSWLQVKEGYGETWPGFSQSFNKASRDRRVSAGGHEPPALLHRANPNRQPRAKESDPSAFQLL